MTRTERQLATIGIVRRDAEPPCWRTTRITAPGRPVVDADGAPDPSESPAVLHWRAMLRRSRRPSPFRVRRA